jgi:hypothetical protein
MIDRYSDNRTLYINNRILSVAYIHIYMYNKYTCIFIYIHRSANISLYIYTKIPYLLLAVVGRVDLLTSPESTSPSPSSTGASPPPPPIKSRRSSVTLNICTYMYKYMDVYIYKCTYIHKHTNIYIHIYIYIYMSTYIYFYKYKPFHRPQPLSLSLP